MLLHRFFIYFALVNSSNKCPVSWYWWKKMLLVLLFHIVLVWWRRWAGKNNLILAIIHDMQMTG